MSGAAVAPDPGARLGRLPMFVPLRVRDYRLVWFGESVSLLGDQFHFVALSWLVLSLTGSGLALGSVLMAAAIPRGLFLLVGGALTDRISPRRLMLWSNALRALVTASIAALVLGARIELWQLVVAGVIFGTVDAVFFPAIGTIVARLVPADRLAPANALLQGTQQLMQTVGPAIAGFAIAVIGVGAAFVVDAATFVVAAVAVWLVAGVRGAAAATTSSLRTGVHDDPGLEPAAPEPAAPEAVAPEPHGSVVAALAEGARSVMGDPVMRMLVLLSTAFNFAFTGPVVVGLPWLVQVRFAGDAALLGLLFAAFGGGSFLGIVFVGLRPRTEGLGRLVLVIATGLGIGLAAIGLASAPAVGVICFLIGLGVGYLNVQLISWTQARTAPHLLGRTMSFLMLGSVVGAPVSLAVAGLLVDVNATALFLAAGGLILATVLAGLVSGFHRSLV
jgi:hypothetical protein